MSLEREINTARSALQAAILDHPNAVTRCQNYLTWLENLRIATLYMPAVAASVRLGFVVNYDHICVELDNYITRLRAKSKNHLAADREQRTILFRLNPNIHTLRRIWIR